MLCRAVLTALALSCTFPRELTHAHGQGTPRKVHRKDLICVLWLSGLQKEDLDVNMLRKLQRHNVNIDDNHRENLRKACLNTYTTKNSKNEDDGDPKATTLALESETEANTKSAESEPNKWSTMLNILINEKHNSEDNDSTIMSEKVESVNNRPRLENYSEIYNLEGTTESNPIENHAVSDNQQNLANILNFWKMFTTPKTPVSDHTVSVLKSAKIHKRISKEKMSKKSARIDFEQSSKEKEQINKLIAEYFSKTLKLSTTQSTVISNDDLHNLSKLTQQFENFFKLMAKSKILPTTDIIKSPETSDMATDNSNIPQQTFLLKASNKKVIESDSNKHSISDISHLLLFNDQLKKTLEQTSGTYLPPYSSSINKDQVSINQQFDGVRDPSVLTYQPTTTKDTVQQQPVTAFSQDVIEKIAESVKAKVLKDLRHEIISTTSEKTKLHNITTSADVVLTSTTVAATTEKPLVSTEAAEVLKSIMELFKEFKALKDEKDKTLSTTTNKPLTADNYDIKNVEVFSPWIIEKKVGKISPYKTGVTPEISTILYESHQPQRIIETHAPINRSRNDNLNHNNLLFPVKNMGEAEIIQTNSREIAPLGIPLRKPLTLIHQNIVVPTSPPAQARITKEHFREWSSNYHLKSYDLNEPRNFKSSLDHYRYFNFSEYDPIPADQQSHSRFHSYPIHEPIPSQYKPYTSHRDSNYSNNNDYQPYHRDPNHMHKNFNQSNEFTNQIQYNSKPSYHHSQYDSDHMKLSPSPSKYDLMPTHYSTRMPRLRLASDNDHYDVRNKEPRYEEDQKQFKPRALNRPGYNYRLGYTPRHKIFVQSKIDAGFGHNNGESNNEYKSTIGARNRNPDIKRFHEQLEGVDTLMDEKEDGGSDLPSRQQLAINTMKTRHDDSHFSNFLKTQQKVNDMLERMLQSKNPDSRSVVEVM